MCVSVGIHQGDLFLLITSFPLRVQQVPYLVFFKLCSSTTTIILVHPLLVQTFEGAPFNVLEHF